MAKRSKAYQAAAEKIAADVKYEPAQAIDLAKELIKKAAGVKSGSATPHTVKVAHLSADQVREISTTKMPDLNANDLDMADRIIAGTARSMGITTDIEV